MSSVYREWRRDKKYTIFVAGTAIPMAQQAAYIERLTDLSVGICTAAECTREEWERSLAERQVLVLEGLEEDLFGLDV